MQPNQIEWMVQGESVLQYTANNQNALLRIHHTHLRVKQRPDKVADFGSVFDSVFCLLRFVLAQQNTQTALYLR